MCPTGYLVFKLFRDLGGSFWDATRITMKHLQATQVGSLYT